MSQQKTMRYSSFGRNLLLSCLRKPDGVSEDPNQIQSYEASLLREVEKLKPIEESSVASLQWLLGPMKLAIRTHQDIQNLISKHGCRRSQGIETWVNEYLIETAKLLEVCNGLTFLISEIERHHLLVKHSLGIISTLNNDKRQLSKEELERARLSLHDWLDSISKKSQTSAPLAQQKVANYGLILKSLADNLTPPKELTSKGDNFWYICYSARAMSIFACTLVALAVSRVTRLPDIKLHLIHQFSWSHPVINLLQIGKEQARYQTLQGRVMPIRELVKVEVFVKGLLLLLDTVLEHPLMGEQTEHLMSIANELKHASDSLSEGLDTVGKCLSEFFHTLLASRSLLLDQLVEN